MVVINPTDNGADRIARVVVSNVPVLTSGTRYDQDESRKDGNVRSTVVTVMATPEDAERIACASDGLMLTRIRSTSSRRARMASGRGFSPPGRRRRQLPRKLSAAFQHHPVLPLPRPEPSTRLRRSRRPRRPGEQQLEDPVGPVRSTFGVRALPRRFCDGDACSVRSAALEYAAVGIGQLLALSHSDVAAQQTQKSSRASP